MKRFEEVLGRPISTSEFKSVPTLNDLSPDQLRDTRTLAARASVLAAAYLCDLVKKCSLSDAADFLEDVVKHDVDVATWGRRDILCIPAVPLSVLLSQPLSSTLGVLAELSGERWWRRVPSMETWGPSEFSGAPAVMVRSVPYWWSGPDTIDYLLLSDDPVERIDDLTVAGRRWIASRVEWVMRDQPAYDDPRVVADRMGLHGPLSEDAKVAIRGLVRERAQVGLGEGLAPGFRGPTEWYS